MKTFLLVLVAAANALAQVPLAHWKGDTPPRRASSTSLVLMEGSTINLGPISADFPAKVQVPIFNPAPVLGTILGGPSVGVSAAYLEAPLEGIEIAPGGVKMVTIQVDPKILARDGAVRVNLKTNSKDSPFLRLMISATVETPAVVCEPFPGSALGSYDAATDLLATSNPLPVVFSTNTTLAGKIQSWWIEDPQAPLAIEEVYSSAGGAEHTWEGRIVLKRQAAGGPKLEGMTRVFVTTANGKTGFSTILWKITKK